VPLGVNRTWVKYVEKGAWPDTRRFFSVLRCNHCTDAPCVTICPTQALYKRKDGIVDFDTDRCIGCKSCMQACPYDALYIDPNEHTAQKCNYCAHRVDVGLQPACVVVCPEQAIIAGDLDDPASVISRTVATERLAVRAPEQGTGPNLFYKGVETANLDPARSGALADSGVWRDAPNVGESWLAVDLTPKPTETTIGNFGSEVAPSPPPTVSGRGPDAPPRVVYNTDHPMPWGWKVSSYFLTKGISAGIAMAAAVALAADGGTDSVWTRWLAPLLAGLFLLLTGALLVWDLKRPDRFLYLLTKGNPSSWLVRGAWILGVFALLAGLWFLIGIFDVGFLEPVIWASAVLGVGVAGYTAFLFGQAEGRDLWQTPVLVWHMVGGALAVGAGASLVAGLFFDDLAASIEAFAWVQLVGAGMVGLMSLTELFGPHTTTNAEAALHHMTRGEFRNEWWLGQLLVVVVPLAAAIAVLNGADVAVGAVGGISAMIGAFLADDAFVKAGQSVPLS
jgi:Fe-S-cluster-containing dehydrogenase component/formate-dependent nitrite reductase membrane component NrfD